MPINPFAYPGYQPPKPQVPLAPAAQQPAVNMNALPPGALSPEALAQLRALGVGVQEADPYAQFLAQQQAAGINVNDPVELMRSAGGNTSMQQAIAQRFPGTDFGSMTFQSPYRSTGFLSDLMRTIARPIGEIGGWAAENPALALGLPILAATGLGLSGLGGGAAGGASAGAGGAAAAAPAAAAAGGTAASTAAGAGSILGSSFGLPAAMGGAALPAGAGVLLPGATAAGAAGAAGAGSGILGNIWGALGGGPGGSVLGGAQGALGVLGALGAASGGNDLSDLLGLTDQQATNSALSSQLSIPGINLPGGGGARFDPATNQITTSLGDMDPLRQSLLSTSQGNILASGNTGQLAADRLAAMRAQSQPYEQEAFNRINNSLFSRGRLGLEDTATGTAYRDFARGLNMADLQRQVEAQNFASQEAQNLFGRGIQGTSAVNALGQDSLNAFMTALNAGLGRSNVQLRVGTQLGDINRGGTNILDLLGSIFGSQ